jgi:hypothetical protein
MGSRNRVIAVYVDDTGASWGVSAPAYHVSQAALGGTIGDPTVLTGKPMGLRMRKAACRGPDGKLRYVTAYTNTASAWTTDGTSVTVVVDDTMTLHKTKISYNRNERFGKQTQQTS